MMRLLLVAALIQALLSSSTAFTSPSSPVAVARKSINTNIPLYNTPENTTSEEESSSSSSSTLTLEEKMKSWEASEEEIRAATLGGVIPGSSGDDAGRTDAFDIGLYIAFPIMVIGCLAFAFFPLIVSNIDVTSVGPPPTS